MFKTIKDVKLDHIYFDSRTTQGLAGDSSGTADKGEAATALPTDLEFDSRSQAAVPSAPGGNLQENGGVGRTDPNRLDSRAQAQSNLSSLKEFRETAESEFTAVRLAFRMKVYSIPTDYSDIFQLAPVNSGIRMELSSPARLGMVVGYDNKDKYKGFVLTESLTLNQWYSVTMKIDIKKRLKVTLNGSTVVNYSTDPGLKYKISDIVVGAGFSKTRKFAGKISDFFIQYQMFEKRQPLTCFGILIIKHVAGLALLLNLFLILIPTKRVSLNS